MNYEQRKRLDTLLGRKPRPAIDYNPEWSPSYAPRERYRWLENATKAGGTWGAGPGALRLAATMKDPPDCAGGRRESCGGYVDNFQLEVTHGAVLQLPARDGRPQYVPACTDPYNADCFVADFHAVTDELRDALRWGDRMAERYAEDAREYEAKDQAELQIAEARDEIKAARVAASALVHEIRAARVTSAAGGRLARDFPAICHALRAQIARYRAEVSEYVQRIRELMANPWAAVE